jgi:epoxyqueuosine reductase
MVEQWWGIALASLWRRWRNARRVTAERNVVTRSDGELEMAEQIAQQILDWGASLVGFADLGEAAPPLFSSWPRAVSIAVALDPAALAGVRDGPTAEYYREYSRVNRALNEIAGRAALAIHSLGFRAEPFPATVPEEPGGGEWVRSLSVAFQHKTAATRAGLGWVGKNALLVTQQFGPRIRLATVLTDMPLPVGEPVTAGECGECSACVKACPASAIEGREWQAGLEREALVDARACWETSRRLLRERVGVDNAVCGVCLSVCPVGSD